MFLKTRFIWLLLALVACAGVLQGQTKAPDIPADHAARMVKGLDIFKKHVKPVLVERCLKCHGGRNVESELDLSERDGLLKGGTTGPAIVPGKARESLLVKLISHERKPHMPHKASQLPAGVIAHIAAWIDHGAPYDTALVTSKVKAPSWTEKVVADEARQFWSFQPLRRGVPPAVRDEAWCRTPIDRFILSKQEAAGVRPNPAATRQQLLRRAYFDLIGLPPTLEETNAFLNDSAPDAYERMIDRLLGSPHYGERWARHWLDLARFAESHGFEHDYDRPSAYHYRDFVIEALNMDLPYTTFVKWQIAGDEYEPGNNLALKATGFLAAGVHSTQITKNEVAKHRYDEMDDKLATIGTAMLGLTIGCARCHDHKFDPIPQRDYYRLLSTFTTAVRSEIDMNLDPEGYAKAKQAFDKEHEPYRRAMEKFEAERLPARLLAWEESAAAKNIAWEYVELVKIQSKEGATFTPQDDSSVLASGKNDKHDTYTFVARTNLTGIRAVRLEALADPSLVKGGPGRAANGNFALSDFQLTVQPAASGGRKPPEDPKPAEASKPIRVKLKNPRASFEQKGLPVAATIDGNEKSAWAVDPQLGKDHAAVFETESPIGFADGTELTFTLHFKNNDGHNIGRPRLAVSTLVPMDLGGIGMPAKAREILQTPAPARNDKQKADLLKWYRTVDADWRGLDLARREHLQQAPKPNIVKALIATEGLTAVRLHTQGEDFLDQTHFLKRGDVDQQEEVATQSFLQVLMASADGGQRWQQSPPAGWRTSYRRRALAEWITDVDHGAGRLLARVIVNRLWQHHLGRGLVATPSDFGNRGERPAHPELLDWLASELIANGWKLKPIHKLIMTSAVYRQRSAFDEARAKIDRDNKLCWRVPVRRLEAEIIRDSLLAASGELDRRMFGPGTLDEGSKRRSIYFTVKRSKLVPMMTIFDAPEALGGMAERPTTTIAPQALHLMNNPQVRHYAFSLARRIAPDEKTSLEDAIQAAYRQTLARPPQPEELTDSLAFVRQQLETYSGPDRRDRALADFCQVLMCLNEFVYVD